MHVHCHTVLKTTLFSYLQWLHLRYRCDHSNMHKGLQPTLWEAPKHTSTTQLLCSRLQQALLYSQSHSHSSNCRKRCQTSMTIPPLIAVQLSTSAFQHVYSLAILLAANKKNRKPHPKMTLHTSVRLKRCSMYHSPTLTILNLPTTRCILFRSHHKMCTHREFCHMHSYHYYHSHTTTQHSRGNHNLALLMRILTHSPLAQN